MIAQIKVATGEGALRGFFVDGHDTYGCVSAVVSNDAIGNRRILSREVIIIIGLLIDLRAGGAAWKGLDASVLLNEAGVGSPTITRRPGSIVDSDSPEKLGLNSGRARRDECSRAE